MPWAAETRQQVDKETLLTDLSSFSLSSHKPFCPYRHQYRYQHHPGEARQLHWNRMTWVNFGGRKLPYSSLQCLTLGIALVHNREAISLAIIELPWRVVWATLPRLTP